MKRQNISIYFDTYKKLKTVSKVLNKTLSDTLKEVTETYVILLDDKDKILYDKLGGQNERN